MVYLKFSQTLGHDVVGAKQKNDMDQTHPDEERYQAQGHELIFAEQFACPDHSSPKTGEYDGDGESCAPPTEKQRGIVGIARPWLRRTIAP